MFQQIMQVYLIILSVCLAGALLYIVISKHFTDRLVGVNLISTLILNTILVLSLFLAVSAFSTGNVLSPSAAKP